MPVFHFLNVLRGDCSVIQHGTGHVTVVDVFNAQKYSTLSESESELSALRSLLAEVRTTSASLTGNFNQKEHPVNPISYLRSFGVDSIFRFMLTHPDMDHMGGIKDLFESFSPTNFWDTENNEEKNFEEGSPYSEEDWKFYKHLRDSKPDSDPNRLTLYSGARGKYYNQNEAGQSGGDGLSILAPTPQLVAEANESGDHNDCSYVILYRAPGGRVLLCGDSHDKTWEHILKKHEVDVADVDLLIAPHHGRKSGRSYDFLDIVKPKLTFFGNAESEDLAYGPWQSRGLPVITNNEANCMVVDAAAKPMNLYVTHKPFAKKLNPSTYYSEEFKAYYCGTIV